MQRLLSSDEAAPLIGVTPKTLANWRVAGRGPQHIRAGRKVTYDVADIEIWKADRRFSSTSQRVAA